MKRLTFMALIALSVALAQATRAVDNSWTNSASGKWEDAANWSLGVAPSHTYSILITNANSKTVTIDVATSVGYPGALTITNLTLSAPNMVTNTLSLTSVGSPLTVKKNVVIGHGGLLWLTNSALATAAASYPDVQGSVKINGRLELNGGSLQLNGTMVGSAAGESGTLAVTGGSLTIPSYPVGGYLILADALNSTGTVSIAGTLTVNGSLIVGGQGVGNFTLTSGALSAGLTVSQGGQGTVTFAGGTGTLTGFTVGSSGSGTSTLWVTGGNHFVYVGESQIGGYGVGEMILSNGTIRFTSDLIVAYSTNGTLRVVGGTLDSGLRLGYNGGRGQVWMTGGQILATNAGASLSIQKRGQLTVSNGVVIANTASIGTSFQSSGTFTVAGGTSTIYSNIIAGNCAVSATGTVLIAGGRLLVTNSSVDATIEIRSGALTVNSGTLIVNRLVMTNACAQFIRTGGTLIYSTAILGPNRDDDGDGMANGWEQAYGLDPLNAADANADNDGDGQSNLQEYLAGTDPTNSASAFRILGVVATNGDMLVSWATAGGRTNAVQSAPELTPLGAGQAGGYTNVSPNIIIAGSGDATTNYLDAGAVTNDASRYYRIRLVP